MAERPSGPNPSAGGSVEPPAPAAPAEHVRGEPEQYGPITVARHVKDDGRELLLYRRSAGP